MDKILDIGIIVDISGKTVHYILFVSRVVTLSPLKKDGVILTQV